MGTFNNATYGLSNTRDLSLLIGGDLVPSLGVPAQSDSHHVQSLPAHSSLTQERLVYSEYCVVPISRLQGSHRPYHRCVVARHTFFVFSLLTYPTTGSRQPGPSLAHSSLARDPQPRFVFQRSHRTLEVRGQTNIPLAKALSMSTKSWQPRACAGPTYTQKRRVLGHEKKTKHTSNAKSSAM